MFSIVVCMDEKQGIGKDNGLPWNNPEELKWFKKLTASVSDETKKNAVIMGRKTWESLPSAFRPLRDRHNVVLTRNKEWQEPGITLANSLEAALEELRARDDIESIFVIGGGQVYEEAVAHPSAALIFASVIPKTYDCDTFFPALPENFVLASTISLGSFISKIIANTNYLD